MKKNSKKGFTLIELLAVITIMGILMMVAIPAVSRTIENSRRDTFADIAHEYINAVRNAMLADNIECYNPTNATNKWKVASATNTGSYYFPICTDAEDCDEIKFGSESSTTLLTGAEVATSTADLMESGGKSPFGNAELKGYVILDKTVSTTTGGDLKTNSKYYIILGDTGGHGLAQPTLESDIKRNKILMTLTEEAKNTVTEKRVVVKGYETNEDGSLKLDNGKPIEQSDEYVPIPCRIS